MDRQSPVISHSVRYQYLRLDSTPALPLSVAPSPLLYTTITVQSEPGHFLFPGPPCYSLILQSQCPLHPSLSVLLLQLLEAGAPLSLICDYTLSLSVDTTVERAVSWMVNGSVPDTSQDGRISTDGDTHLLSSDYLRHWQIHMYTDYHCTSDTTCHCTGTSAECSGGHHNAK